MNFNTLNELRTDNLILRKITFEDRNFLKGLFQDSEIQKYYVYHFVPDEIKEQPSKMLDYLLNDIYKNAGFSWIIIENIKGLLSTDIEKCGFITFEFWDSIKNARITFSLLKSKRGRGIMIKTLQLVLEHLKKINIETVEADIDIENIAASKVISKLGFTADKKVAYIDPSLVSRVDIRGRYLWRRTIKKIKCEMCGAEETTVFNVFEILDIDSDNYDYNPQTTHSQATNSIIPKGFDFAFSDVTQQQKHGTIYFYKVSEESSFHDFCSLQCAFNFSVKKCSQVIYCDPEKTMLRGITPQVIRIFNNLTNGIAHNFKGQPQLKISYNSKYAEMIPKCIFTQFRSNQKSLSIEKTKQIFASKTLRFFFINEKSIPKNFIPNLPSSSVKEMSGLFNTGRYHFVFSVNLPEYITEISDKKNLIIQEWELLNYIPKVDDKLKGVYHFVAWGKEPCPENNFVDNTHHDGKNIFIDSAYFHNIILKIYDSTNFDDEKFRNTIGFELITVK